MNEIEKLIEETCEEMARFCKEKALMHDNQTLTSRGLLGASFLWKHMEQWLEQKQKEQIG